MVALVSHIYRSTVMIQLMVSVYALSILVEQKYRVSDLFLLLSIVLARLIDLAAFQYPSFFPKQFSVTSKIL